MSTSVVPEHVWEDFKVKLANKWASYTDFEGKPLKMRPHWAKENPRELVYDGKTYTGTEYIKMMYEDEFKEFRDHLREVCDQGGYAISDLKDRFSNHYLDNVLGAVFK